MLTALFLSISSLFYSATPDSVCTVQSAPSFEPFEDSQWQIGALIFGNPGQLDPCWSRSDTTGFYWTPFVGSTSGTWTGPNFGVGGSGKYLYTSPSSGPSSTSLITPRYYIAPLDTPAVEFYTHIYDGPFGGGGFNSFVVDCDTGNGWFSIQTISTSSQTSKNSPWDARNIYLEPFRADTMRFKFTVNRASNAYLKVGFDEFSIRDTTCQSFSSPFSYNGSGFTRNFSVVSPQLNYTYFWYFGDGASSQGLTNTHTYASTGTYTVNLVTTSDCGRIDSSQGTIQICSPIQPVISSTITGNTVSFTAQGSGLTNASWSFGDGATSTSLNPTHTYASSGVYVVQLSTSNSCGEISSTVDTLFICDVLVPEFTAQILTTNAQGMTVQFDAQVSLGNIQSYQWGFGDNTTGVGKTVTKTYIIPGLNYIVTLTTVDSCGQSLSIAKPLTQVSVPDTDMPGLFVYPNPAQDRIFLASPLSHGFLFGQIFHPSGKQVAFLPRGTAEWDIRYLSPGMYYLVLTFSDQRTTVPLIVAQP